MKSQERSNDAYQKRKENNQKRKDLNISTESLGQNIWYARMPPRGTRGARGGRSSRGGRGGAAAAAAASASASASTSSAPVDDGPSQSNIQPRSAADGNDATPDVISVRSTPSAQEIPPLRQSTTPSAASRAGGTRFKPKNVRRDAAERQRLEQERNRDLASKIKQEEREQRAEERRARRGRGRGDAMSQRGFIRRTVTASGPFSGVPSGMLLSKFLIDN